MVTDWSPAILIFLPWPTGWWLAREAQKTALHVYLLQFLEGILCTQKLFIFLLFLGIFIGLLFFLLPIPVNLIFLPQDRP